MATWKDKLPSEMTLEELQSAKTELRAEFDSMAERYNDLQVAIAHVDYEIGQRFQFAAAPVGNLSGMPQYPRERLFGAEGLAASETMGSRPEAPLDGS